MGGLLFGLGVFIAVLYLPWVPRPPGWRRSLRKTLPVALFALAAVADGAPVMLCAALALSALGDLALSRPGQRAFLAGMIAFALAHLAYIALMIGAGAALPPPLPALALILAALSTEIWLAPRTGALRWPVRAYVAVIAAMGLMALGLPGGYAPARAAALLFMLSDALLALETFVIGSGKGARADGLKAWLSRAVWITYIAAQAGFLLAFST